MPEFWIISYSPPDYPDSYVARRWAVVAGRPSERECYVSQTLERAREIIPEGLVHHVLIESAAPILEIWL